MFYIQNLRGVAIVMIVSTHAISVLFAPGFVAKFLNIVIGNGSILFLAIAGYIFSRVSSHASYFDVLKSKFQNVLIPYFVTSFPAALIYAAGLKQTHDWLDIAWLMQQPIILRFLYLYLTGAHLGPLWFIPMIMTIFLVAPAFVRLKTTNLYIMLVFLTCAALFVGRPPHDSNVFQAAIFYIPIFLIGICLDRNEDLLRKIPLTAFIIAGVIVVLYAASCLSWPLLHDERIQLLVFGACVPLAFSLASQLFKRRITTLDILGRLSFPIYFLHGYVAAALRILFARYYPIPFNSILEVALIPALALLMIFLSISGFVIVRLVTGKRSRWIVGA